MKRSLLIVFLLGLSCTSWAKATTQELPKDFSITVETKDIPGGKAWMRARIDAPVEAVWRAILDSNNHAGKYPKIMTSFCMNQNNAQSVMAENIHNSKPIIERFLSQRCEPAQLRQKNQTWEYYLFQEIDYPFPLTDRWIISKTTNDESLANKGEYTQKGSLLTGRQPIYEFSMNLKSHPDYPGQTDFTFYFWSDPGGLIMDWMIKLASKEIAPEFMRVLEREAKRINASTANR